MRQKESEKEGPNPGSNRRPLTDEITVKPKARILPLNYQAMSTVLTLFIGLRMLINKYIAYMRNIHLARTSEYNLNPSIFYKILLNNF